MNTTETMIARGQRYVMNTYGRFPYIFERGEGVYLFDSEGKKYLDFIAGIAVNCLGYNNERLQNALREQAVKLLHCSNLFWVPQQIEAAELLVENSCFDKAFFCNSGAEAIESALKLARKYGDENGGRYEIISMRNSFHGRTMGAITATGQTKYQKGLSPILPGIKYAVYNDFDSVLAQVTDKTCGILLEPVQGEGGVLPADPEFMRKIRALCDEKDILMMVDEVQTGMGRTGRLFGYEHFDVEPDVISLAKGLGGGFPIGVMMAKEKAAQAFRPGDHASTFGGNPMAATAAVTVLKEMLEKDLPAHAKKVGDYMAEKAAALAAKYPMLVEGTRGLGLMQGIILKKAEDLIPIRLAAAERGLLVIGAGYNVLRMVPPLIITEKEIDEGMEILDQAFATIA